MGIKTVIGIEFVTEECCRCGMSFAMTEDFQTRRRKDKRSFYCPSGHSQHYIGKPEEQKLREQLERTQLQYEAASGRAAALQRQRDDIKRAHTKMRERVSNGVCPCCNRTFQNFMDHMKTQHPDFGKSDTFKMLRDTFGLTQSSVADEAGVSPSHVSKYERGKHVSEWADTALTEWVEDNTS